MGQGMERMTEETGSVEMVGGSQGRGACLVMV